MNFDKAHKMVDELLIDNVLNTELNEYMHIILDALEGKRDIDINDDKVIKSLKEDIKACRERNRKLESAGVNYLEMQKKISDDMDNILHG